MIPSPTDSSEVSFNMGDDQSEETRSVASSRRLSALTSCDSRTLIVWVEDWDDIDHVPLDQLAQEWSK